MSNWVVTIGAAAVVLVGTAVVRYVIDRVVSTVRQAKPKKRPIPLPPQFSTAKPAPPRSKGSTIFDNAGEDSPFTGRRGEVDREKVLASASPEMRLLIADVENSHKALKEEMRIVREATKPRPVSQFFGNFFWNAGSLVAGIIIGHFVH
jgi:hypothetical protein